MGFDSELVLEDPLKTSGQSLMDNNFTVLDTLFSTQACLIANKIVLQKKANVIGDFMCKVGLYNDVSKLKNRLEEVL